jgi:hypothetical protein
MARRAMSTSRRRIADFEKRAAAVPAHVLRHHEHGWRYIGIHPFADDYELLQRIDWPSDKCRSVDAYWMVHGDVHLLQVDAEGQALRPYGLYQRWVGGNGYAANLVAVIRSEPILRARFEAIMARIAASFPLNGKPAALTAIHGEPWASE